MAKNIYEITDTVITKNMETQEVEMIVEKSTKSIKIEKEEGYIKIYLKDIAKLHGLAPQQNQFLFELFSMAGWNTNEIQLSVGKKRELVSKLGTSMQTLNNAISMLIKKDILLKKDTGLYTLNPFLFGKGDWNSVKALRLTIGYDFFTGEKTIEAEQQEVKTKIEREWDITAEIDNEIKEMIAESII